MQSSAKISSNIHPPQFSWNSSLFPRNSPLLNLNFNPKNTFKASSLSTSFSIPHDSEDSQQPFIKKNPSLLKTELPVVIMKNGKNYKYFWDGNLLELVCVDGENPSTIVQAFELGIRNFLIMVKDFFIPKQVTENYIEYVKWKFLHRIFSSALQVLATQAMFRAIGVGYAQSLPSAAAMNWVLKDGLGRLSRCIYTACVGTAFDTNLKRVRFATSVMFSLSIGVELMTPTFPHCFLLLASVANIAKQISWACYLATGTAVHRSFALADNLGEVSAKAQIQTVCFDNLGLLLAASLNVMFKNNERLQAGLPFVVYPIFSAIDLCGIYQSLKHVHLQTITKDRLELILEKWIQFGYVPSPAEVSKLEGINLLDYAGEFEALKIYWPFSHHWLKTSKNVVDNHVIETGRKKADWPIRIGCLDPKRQIPHLTMLTMNSLSEEDFHFICLETCLKSEHQGILLSLREGARTEDIIVGLLQACYIRQALLSGGIKWKSIIDGRHISHLNAMNWFKLIQDSKSHSQLNLNTLHEQMIKLNWATKNILLGTEEQVRYSFKGEK